MPKVPGSRRPEVPSCSALALRGGPRGFEAGAQATPTEAVPVPPFSLLHGVALASPASPLRRGQSIQRRRGVETSRNNQIYNSIET